ncbi:uncharacterized protein LOC108604135 [Drosophila busckii]|uniref:uncharacterized protein LOC108604135 n=1 Tax=Drosophila busckii TaxID=30019 RepID=UPI00083EBDE3|nr:uncharacterized protein LOC108604135 [Drosophila busckii]
MGDKIHRVVVALTDAAQKSPTSKANASGIDRDIRILDRNSMLLRLPVQESKASFQPRYFQQLEFDSVGFDSEKHIRAEFGELMTQMFKRLCNGCLLRLTPWRAYNLKLLTRLLVTEVDKLLLALNYRLLGIQVEYFDVRKFDMVNLLISSSKQQPQVRKLNNTSELFQWLHNEYIGLRGRITGDDYMSIEFRLCSNSRQQQHKLQLSIFNIFDCHARKDLSEFFKALPGGRSSQGSLLTDVIKESFDRKRNIYTLVLCEMPGNKAYTPPIQRFLSLADMAYLSIKALDNKCNSQLKLVESLPQLPAKPKGALKQQPRLTRKSESFTMCPTRVELSQQHLSRLSYWYKRIDKVYAGVRLAMEEYYNTLYCQRVLDICRLDQPGGGSQSGQSGGDCENPKNKNSAAATNFQEQLSLLSYLEEEVTHTSFACTLAVYMNTKHHELLKEEEALQKRQVDNLGNLKPESEASLEN